VNRRIYRQKGGERLTRSGAAAVAEEVDVQARPVAPAAAEALGGEPSLGLGRRGRDALGHEDDIARPPSAEAGEESVDLAKVRRAADDELELAVGCAVDEGLEGGDVQAAGLVARAPGAGGVARIIGG